MSLEIFFFFVLALVIVVTSVLVIMLRNPIYSAVSLLGTFLGVAGMYALCNAPVVAFVQVMVYAGAVMVLLLFIVMLMGLGKRKFDDGKWTVTKGVAGLMVLFVLVAVSTGISTVSVESPDGVTTNFPGLSRVVDVPTTDDIARMHGAVNEGAVAATEAEREVLRRHVSMWDQFGSANALGGLMFTRWLLVFEVVGLLLLASIAGAVVIAKRRV